MLALAFRPETSIYEPDSLKPIKIPLDTYAGHELVLVGKIRRGARVQYRDYLKSRQV
jgi:hypothetical protein